jgi:prepilin-type N-terminal cleavage/methylation domain-containing protein
MNSSPSTATIAPRSATNGFTILELIVVILIMTIALVAATPMTINYMQQKGVREAADQLAVDLQRAKLLAIQRNANCTVTINSPGPNQYTIGIINQVVDLADYAGGVVFSNSPDVSASLITFTPFGVCQNSGAVYVTNTNRRYRIRASGAGGVSVHLSTSGGWM